MKQTRRSLFRRLLKAPVVAAMGAAAVAAPAKNPWTMKVLPRPVPGSGCLSSLSHKPRVARA